MAENTDGIVMSIIDNINKGQDSGQYTTVTTRSKSVESALYKVEPVIRGKPKSGRFWKSSKEKFSTINKTKGLRMDFEKKTALRIELQHTKEMSKKLAEEVKLKEAQRKERRRENIKRAAENKKKAEVVQVITNSAKLKRLRKKQLRFIEKRDTTKIDNSK